jgi:hypothetical protein
MKRSIFSLQLLFCLIALGNPFEERELFGDDNQSGRWLTVEDQFVWPSPIASKIQTTALSLPLKSLSAVQAQSLKSYWPEESLPNELSVIQVDLNEDQKPEIFLKIPSYGGSGGPYYEILTSQKNGSYQSIGAIQGWGFGLLVKRNGWLQIKAMGSGGGGHYTRYLMSFIKGSYQIIRNESHNFNTKEVQIRKTPSFPSPQK